MADQRPPRVVGNELDTWMALYAFQRESLLRKLEGVDDADARSAAVPSGTSLLWLVKHCGNAERLWFFHRFAATEGVPLTDAVLDDDSVVSVSVTFRDQWPEIVDLVRSTDLDGLAAGLRSGEPLVTLRWILGHMLEEVARHAGHADIIREQLDGQTGR